MLRFYLFLLFTIGLGQSVYSQQYMELRSDFLGTLELFAHEKSIYIRIVPDLQNWEANVKTGYVLERVTIEDGQGRLSPTALEASRKTWVLNLKSAKEWSAPKVDEALLKSAQWALFGEEKTPNPSAGEEAETYLLMRKAFEQESRRSLALMAADASFSIAENLGLGLRDNTAEQGKTYLYAVRPNKETVERGRLQGKANMISLDDAKSLLPLTALHVEAYKKGAAIYWDAAEYGALYRTYKVERSSKKGKFERINELPIFAEYDKDSRYAFFLDSSENAEQYSYRVVGVTAFGAEGQPSEAMRPKAVLPPFEPIDFELETGRKTIRTLQPDVSYNVDNHGVKLKWNALLPKGNYQYQVLVSDSENTNFVPLMGYPTLENSTTIPVPQGLFTSAKYYKVRVLDKAGKLVGDSEVTAFKLEEHQKPQKPLLRGVSVDGNAISLNWTPAAAAEKHHLYKRKKGSNAWTRIHSENQASQSYVDSDVQMGVEYEYLVQAENAPGNLANSEIMTTSIPRNSSLDFLPEVKSIAQADGILQHIVWEHPLDLKLLDFQIFKKNKNGEWLRIAAVSADQSLRSARQIEGSNQPHPNQNLLGLFQADLGHFGLTASDEIGVAVRFR